MNNVIHYLFIILLILSTTACSDTQKTETLTLHLGQDVVTIPLPPKYKGTTTLPPQYLEFKKAVEGEHFTPVAAFFTVNDMKLFEKDFIPDNDPFIEIGTLSTFVPDRIYHSSFLESLDYLKKNKINKDITHIFETGIQNSVSKYITDTSGITTSVKLNSVTTTDLLYKNDNCFMYGIKFIKTVSQGGTTTNVTTYSLFSNIWVDGKILFITSHSNKQDPDALRKLTDFTVSFINGILDTNKKVPRVKQTS